MPRKKSPNLTEFEQHLMEVLWARESGTVGEVLAALETDPPLAFNTVQTTLRVLEQKGYLRHTAEGRAFRYHPLVARDEESRKALHTLLRRFYGSSPGTLAMNLVRSEKLSKDELRHIARLVGEAEGKK